MPVTRCLRVPSEPDSTLQTGVAAIAREMELPDDFPDAVQAAAAQAARNPKLPDADRTDIELITLDPPGAMDLDQAMFVERIDAGYRVYYAIADVAAFVQPGDPVDLEAHRRGETLYGARSKISLHPPVLSEGAASLLPDQVRPALLWCIDLDSEGERTNVHVSRARVKSRGRFDYVGVQARIDAGDAGPMWDVLREIGELRIRRQHARGGISLGLPEQEFHFDGDQWRLAFRGRHPVEDWNEQISLLTGMAAAHLMVQARVGLLRTLPPPGPHAVQRLRRTAHGLEIAWPEEQRHPDFINALDPSNPVHVAMMVNCTTVLRGAGYAAFNGSVPDQPMHSALAAEYAHATAPLRRLVDRYVGEACVSICAGEPVPAWVLDALPDLPETMHESSRRAGMYEHAVLDLAEAIVLRDRVGDMFEGSIVEVDHDSADKGDVIIRDPAIEARVAADVRLPLGKRVKVKLIKADPAQRRIRFQWQPDTGTSHA